MKQAWLSALVVVWLPAFAHAATRVSSDSNCPAAAAIGQRLLGLVAAGGPATAAAVVRSEGENLHIELSAPGEPNQDRSVPAPGDCEVRAEMAALVIAAWLDVMPVGTIPAPGIPPRAPARPRAAASSDPDDPDRSSVAISTRLLLGAGAFGSADGQGASAGVALVAGMPRLIEALGWVLEVSLGLPRQMAVGQGTARYLRPTFALAGSGELGGPRWMVRLQAGLVLGVLSAQGSDFPSGNSSATAVTWGGLAGVTLARAWRRDELWLRLDGYAWPQGRAFESRRLPTDVVIEAPLPEWEARLSAGFSFGID